MATIGRIPETIRRPGQSVARWALDDGQRFERTTTHHRVSIGVGSKAFRFEFERVHQGFATSAPHLVAPGGVGGSRWSSVMLVVLLLLCLTLAFMKMLPAPTTATQYAAVITIPKKSAEVAAVQRPHPRRLVRPAPIARPQPQEGLLTPGMADDAAETADQPASFAEGEVTTITSDVDPDIEAMPAATGERAVAVWGVRRVVKGEPCRDVQVFTRRADGAISVTPGVRCGKGRGRIRD